jgi:heme A synthase
LVGVWLVVRSKEMQWSIDAYHLPNAIIHFYHLLFTILLFYYLLLSVSHTLERYNSKQSTFESSSLWNVHPCRKESINKI